MEVSIQTQRKVKKADNHFAKEPQQPFDSSQEAIKKRKIERLKAQHEELLEQLKKKNAQLSKLIKKKRPTYRKSLGKTSINLSQNQINTSLVSKKELAQAYKQIDMYKIRIGKFASEQINIEALEKIRNLQDQLKYEESVIQNLEKEINFLQKNKKTQEKQLSLYENVNEHNSLKVLEDQLYLLRQKLKQLKSYNQKRQNADKKQQLYQIELERAIKLIKKEYYPGISEKKSQSFHHSKSVSQEEWQKVISELRQLRNLHDQNKNKIEFISKQKNRQIKSQGENKLKLKEKTKIRDSLLVKLEQVTKLIKFREKKKKKQVVEEQKQQIAVQQESRNFKKWIIPQGYCFQQGKVLPDAIFFSDKNVLLEISKIRIKSINIWTDKENYPRIIQFFYIDEKSKIIQGSLPFKEVPQNLVLHEFHLKQTDSIVKVSGSFINQYLSSIYFLSKFGNQFYVEGQKAKKDGKPFTFSPKPHETTSAFFGAYQKIQNEIRICHIGVEFVPDW